MSPNDSSDQSVPDGQNVIRLADFLKISGVVESGGEAKVRIQAGEVTVNGMVETRRRKQLSIGDVVKCLGHEIEVDFDDPEG